MTDKLCSQRVCRFLGGTESAAYNIYTIALLFRLLSSMWVRKWWVYHSRVLGDQFNHLTISTPNPWLPAPKYLYILLISLGSLIRLICFSSLRDLFQNMSTLLTCVTDPTQQMTHYPRTSAPTQSPPPPLPALFECHLLLNFQVPTQYRVSKVLH